MKRVSALVFAFLMIANIGFAQAKKKAAPAPKSVPVTVIVMEGEPAGGVDEGLNAALERFLEVPLDIKTITRDEALKDPKFSGLNLDFMPLYLVHKNAVSEAKFAEPVQQGYLKANNDFIIFEKQTRLGVHAGNERKPKVLELFVMSQCPYGAMAENRIIDAMKLGRIPKDVTIDVRYIVSEDPSNPGSFRSLHGSPEWEENVRQLIIKDKYPNKFWKYLEIRNKDYNSSLWDVAAEEAGINPKVFRKYWKHGLELLKKEAEYSNKIGVSGSPTFLWEGRVLTDMGGLGNISGLEGIAQTNPSSPQAAAAPAGQC